MGATWSLRPPLVTYYYDALVQEGQFVLPNGTTGNYSAHTLTVNTPSQQYHYALRLEQQDFARLHLHLQRGDTMEEALTATFRGY
jgi:hypothetical protein